MSGSGLSDGQTGEGEGEGEGCGLVKSLCLSLINQSLQEHTLLSQEPRPQESERKHRLYSLCPTFMTIFMDFVLHTPPSWFSRPSIVPFDVAERER